MGGESIRPHERLSIRVEAEWIYCRMASRERTSRSQKGMQAPWRSMLGVDRNNRSQKGPESTLKGSKVESA